MTLRQGLRKALYNYMHVSASMPTCVSGSSRARKAVVAAAGITVAAVALLRAATTVPPDLIERLPANSRVLIAFNKPFGVICKFRPELRPPAAQAQHGFPAAGGCIAAAIASRRGALPEGKDRRRPAACRRRTSRGRHGCARRSENRFQPSPYRPVYPSFARLP